MNLDIIRRVFPEKAKLIEEGRCPECGKVIDRDHEFRDQLSVNEHYVSGLCQADQDRAFNSSDEE